MNCIEKQQQGTRYIFIFCLLIFLGFFVLYPLTWYRDEVRWQKVQTWQKIPATVVSHKKAVTGSGRDKRSYSEITYRYEIDKKVFFGYDNGLGGKNLLPQKFRKPGAKVHCFFDPASRKTMLAYREENNWITLFGMVFFGGFAVFSIVQIIRTKNFDARTVPPEFAKRLQPLPELPPRLAVRECFCYKTVKEDPSLPGMIFYAKAGNFRRGLQLLFFGGIFAAFLLIAIISARWEMGLLALLQLLPVYFCLRQKNVFVLNTRSRTLFFSRKAQSVPQGKQVISFDDVQGLYLVWMMRSDCMGILIKTAQYNIVIGCREPQQLMLEALQIADLIDPQLPIYDLIHREFDKKQRQGYIQGG